MKGRDFTPMSKPGPCARPGTSADAALSSIGMASGLEAARAWIRLRHGTLEPVVPDASREKPKRRPREGQSTKRPASSAGLRGASRLFNPSIRGWIAYYGRFYPSALQRIFKPLDRRLVRWAQGKYKRLRSSRYQAWQWLRRLAASEPRLFGHWHAGFAP